MEIPLLQEILIIFGLSIGVLLVCHRLRVPIIVGFFVTGLLCGPHGLAFVDDIDSVQMLAKIGIVLLLFTVGMEFSVRKIMQFRRFFLVGGFLQVSLTTLAGLGIGTFLGRPLGEAIFLGFLLSLSSTTIVMRILEERMETNTPHGRLILGTLIFQDVAVVPMMLLIPVLSGTDSLIDPSFLYLLGKGVLILFVVFFAAARIVPKLLDYVARTGSRELFLLSVLVIGFSVAWLASSLGLSLSLGAFLAGLIIAESEYSNRAIGDILPFRDIFTSFFFVSVGMLLNIGFVAEQPFLILLAAVGVFLLKAAIVGGTAVVVGMPLRTVVLSALALSQVGEFSFILAKAGTDSGIGNDYYYQLFLAVTVLTMALTPSLIEAAPYFASQALRLPLSPKIKSGLRPMKIELEKPLHDHVIIIGLGLTGKNLVRSTKEAEIPYIILELDADVVREEREKGEPIHFGDATHETVLKHAQVEEARAVAVLINDPVAALRIVEVARRLNPKAYLIVRTRYNEEMKPMFQLGADDVIVDEFGSSVEIFTRVLRKYDVPHEKIEAFVTDLRSEGYEMQRLLYQEPTAFTRAREQLSNIGTGTFLLSPNSVCANKSLAEIGLRKNYGLTLVLIKREGETLANFDADAKLKEGDLLVVMGSEKNLERATTLFG